MTFGENRMFHGLSRILQILQNEFMKQIFKTLLTLLTTVLVFPSFVLYRLQSLILPQNQAFASWSQFYALLPGVSGEFLRAAFFKLSVEGWGQNCRLGFGTVVSRPSLRMGDGASTGAYCSLGMVEIGANSMLGSGIRVPSGAAQHGSERLDIPMKAQAGKYQRITIGADCWIGDGCVILADIGDGCIIGAGSVVTKPMENFAVAVGNPARVIRFRDGRETPIVANVPPQSDEL